MYSSVNSAGRLLSSAFGKRAFSSASAESGRGTLTNSVRCYSISGKRAPLATVSTTARQQQQEQEQHHKQPSQEIAAQIGGSTTSKSKVPKFTMARTEFMTADLFARHRQLVEVPENNGGTRTSLMDASTTPRPSFKTLTELAMCKGQTPGEANVPHAKMKQIYAAPASVYMHVVTPDVLIPEAMRLGPLTEPLLGQDTFSDGFSTLNLGGQEEDIGDFVEEFFDTIIANTRHSMKQPDGLWSGRDARRLAHGYQARWIQNDMLDPVDAINEGGASAYQMTSVRRKRKTKMNKHKHRKLRKQQRSLNKRLGK
ncbi:hypothetical protein IW140_004556 [Coemansia sp. RSA 1813]|nr:hypothetical protein EV178_004621 [Coemansia sp. RSA 1646]KAJ1766450.1 hypothetical protein LPJ74_005877 [Coemansia sp. RSA 1843]KAJ2088011.1 hypothetical protein IW138_004519 [Coemansia sp. RSA 986]KAJ2212646.1 hypothetical protein EV179_004472 [Coemansia sp. RSA 487]KAJ2567343.1 hypothetical protein IW140_004556 [Coemansia sp. RSA 1813]